MSNTHLREIGDADLPATCVLLAEGFPRRTFGYWQRALDILTHRPTVRDHSRYGYVLEVDGRLEGVLLLLTSKIDGVVRRNLSSWYVRPRQRIFATMMFAREIRAKETVYLNVSPSESTLPILKAFGFRPYTGGTLVIGTPSALEPCDAIVHPFVPGTAQRLDAATRAVAEAHLGYGCAALVLEDAEGYMLALYRIKWLKRLVPAARFVAGDPVRLVKAAGGLARFILRRGVPFLLADAPLNYSPPSGVRLYPDREQRYLKGVVTPAPGDLRETEIALFGP
jgi:hypothetical protein